MMRQSEPADWQSCGKAVQAGSAPRHSHFEYPPDGAFVPPPANSPHAKEGKSAAIDMVRQMGFVAKSYPGDATLVLVGKQLRSA